MLRVVRAGWRALGASRMRTLLAMLGITIGVGAVVAVVSIGEGTQREIDRAIEAFGTNLLVITPGQTRISAGRAQRATTVTTLMADDAEAIAEQLREVELAVPAATRSMEVSWEGVTAQTTVVATTPDFQQARNFHAERGEFITEHAERVRARDVVLGQTVADALFSGGDPIGARIRIGRALFEVVGVMERKGLDVGGQDEDDQVFIPLSTGQRRLFNISHVTTIYAKVRRGESLDSAQQEIAALLRERHRLREGVADDFAVQNQSELIAAQQQISGSFTVLLTSVGGISLLVGGVGILAVMLMSVRERTREVGLRRAVGATRRDILLQFLTEATVLSVAGSLAGVALGVAGAAVTASVTDWAMAFSVPAALGAVIVSAAIGIIFGIYPARQASLQNSVEALRGR
ncbi:MAG: ABC transporter permease [Armatimonadota bacterium]|jgi:putative ABC transport system permease protein